MKSIKNLKWFTSFIVIIIAFSLLSPSVTLALEGAAGGNADGSEYGGSGGESAADKEAREAAEEAAREAAEAEKAAADAAAASASVAAAGVSGTMSVSAVDTTGPGTPPSGVNVSVNGGPATNMSVEAATAAANALGAATSKGTKSAAEVGVSAEKTVAGYASGSLSDGKVVGSNTGYKGTPAEVRAQEAAYSTAVGVSSLANTLPNTQVTSYTMAPAVTAQPTVPSRMFDPTPIGTQPSTLSYDFSKPSKEFNYGFTADISARSAPTQSISVTPSSNPSYNSFNNDMPAGITSAQYNAQTNSITASFVDGTSRTLNENEIAAINSNTPTPTKSGWTSSITSAVSNTYNSVISGFTSVARTVGSFVGVDIPETPKTTYANLPNITDRINASIAEKTLTDLGIAVTPGVVSALQENRVNVTPSTPSISYGFVDAKSLDSYTQSINNAKADLAAQSQQAPTDWDKVAQDQLSTLQARTAREALEARKDADLNTPPTDNAALAREATLDTLAARTETAATDQTRSIGDTVSPTEAQAALSDAQFDARFNAGVTTESYDPFAPGNPANSLSNPSSVPSNNPTALSDAQFDARFNSTISPTNIGTVPEPGPYNSFTGTNVGVDINSINTISVVNLSGSSNPAENAKAATVAQVAALGGINFSTGDVTALGKALAGELPGSIVGDIQMNEALTSFQIAQAGMIKDVAVTRGFADKASLFGPFDGSLEGVFNAGLNDENKGQFSAFNADTIDKTTAAYNANPDAFNSLAEGLLNGTIASTYGLSIAAPTPYADAYYNASKVSPAWASSLDNVSVVGTAPHAHTVGDLPGEYTTVGQVQGLDNLNSRALEAMNKAAAGGFVSGTGQYSNVSDAITGTSPSINTSQTRSVSSVSSPSNNNVSLPDSAPTPTSRASALGNSVSLPDSAPTPTSRASALSGGFTNTGNNPGNVNASNYTNSIAGTPNTNTNYTNTGNNPGNVNSSNYTNSIAGTPSLNGGFVNTGNNPGNVNSPNYTNSIAGTPNTNTGFVNTGNNPGNVNAPTYSASIPGTPTTNSGFVNTGNNPGNVNSPTYTASIPGTPNTSVTSPSLSNADKMALEAQRLSALQTERARLGELANIKDEGLGLPAGYTPTTNSGFVNTGDNPGNVNASTYSASIPGTPSANTSFNNTGDNPGNVNSPNYTNSIPGTPNTDRDFVNTGDNPGNVNAPTYSASIPGTPTESQPTLSDAQFDARFNGVTTEAYDPFAPGNPANSLSNPPTDKYESYADIAAATDAAIRAQMEQDRINDAYKEYYDSRVTADALTEQARIAAIKDDSLDPPATTPSLANSVWNEVKDVAVGVINGTAQLARSTVDGVKNLLGITAPVDTRVVSTLPQDETYKPFGDNTVPGKLDGQLTTDQNGVTVAVDSNPSIETTAATPANTAPIDARFAPDINVAPAPTTPVNNSYYSPTLDVNLTNNTFNTAPPTGFNTPTPGAPVSMGFDYDAIDDQGNTLNVDSVTGIGTAYDPQGNVIGTRSREETQAALDSGGLSIRSNPDTNPPTNVVGPNDNNQQPDSQDVSVIDTNVTNNQNENEINNEIEVTPTTPAPTNIVDRVVDTVTNTAKTVYSKVENTIRGWLGGGSGSLTNREAGEQSNRDITNQPIVRRELNSLTIHLNIPVQCPVVGLTTGYIYEAEYIEHYQNDAYRPKYVVKPMCGAGGPRTYATEVANDLQTFYGFGRINVDQLLDLMEFNFNTPNEVLVTN